MHCSLNWSRSACDNTSTLLVTTLAPGSEDAAPQHCWQSCHMSCHVMSHGHTHYMSTLWKPFGTAFHALSCPAHRYFPMPYSSAVYRNPNIWLHSHDRTIYACFSFRLKHGYTENPTHMSLPATWWLLVTVNQHGRPRSSTQFSVIRIVTAVCQTWYS